MKKIALFCVVFFAASLSASTSSSTVLHDFGKESIAVEDSIVVRPLKELSAEELSAFGSGCTRSDGVSEASYNWYGLRELLYGTPGYFPWE